QQVRIAAHVESDVVTNCFQPINIVSSQENYSPSRLDHKTFRYFLLTLQAAEQSKELTIDCSVVHATDESLRMCHCLLKSRAVEWLQQIVDSVYLKRLECILIVSGNEYDR